MLSDNVKLGSEWLDAVYPEWWTKIDLSELSVRSPCSCVLGQVFETDLGDGYSNIFITLAWLHPKPVGVQGWANSKALEWCVSHGFAAQVATNFEALDELWITEIKRRWEGGVPL